MSPSWYQSLIKVLLNRFPQSCRHFDDNGVQYLVRQTVQSDPSSHRLVRLGLRGWIDLPKETTHLLFPVILLRAQQAVEEAMMIKPGLNLCLI